MRCPVCHGKTDVVDTRERSYGQYRVRKCLQCGSKFSTQEILSLNVNETSKRMGRIRNNFKRNTG